MSERYIDAGISPNSKTLMRPTMQRVVDPIRPVMPTVSMAPAVIPTQLGFEVDPSDALSEASGAVGPVTYFEPAALALPPNGITSLNPADLTFEWTPSVGADQSRVEVYDNQTLRGLRCTRAGQSLGQAKPSLPTQLLTPYSTVRRSTGGS